ncbi:hypothetical protein BD626DRAFT_169434 [Schizophyllum amplum]|uniref:Uncharacterized protein n=1 Tax=Schizophyllum amplum TaxID=97359 RepID=A0A550CQR0_9AGAR|nr:hypothetical protein BD626DRAFT_169434 [Auriculariopsis ampla]
MSYSQDRKVTAHSAGSALSATSTPTQQQLEQERGQVATAQPNTISDPLAGSFIAGGYYRAGVYSYPSSDLAGWSSGTAGYASGAAGHSSGATGYSSGYVNYSSTSAHMPSNTPGEAEATTPSPDANSDATFVYIGPQRGKGSNILQRIEELGANPNVLSFDAENLTCAACGITMRCTTGLYAYLRRLHTHELGCKAIRTWKDPASPNRLTSEMEAKIRESRLESTMKALAHAMTLGQVLIVDRQAALNLRSV